MNAWMNGVNGSQCLFYSCCSILYWSPGTTVSGSFGPTSQFPPFLSQDIRSWVLFVFCVFWQQSRVEDAAATFSRQQQTLWLVLVSTLCPGLLMNRQPIYPFPNCLQRLPAPHIHLRWAKTPAGGDRLDASDATWCVLGDKTCTCFE